MLKLVKQWGDSVLVMWKLPQPQLCQWDDAGLFVGPVDGSMQLVMSVAIWILLLQFLANRIILVVLSMSLIDSLNVVHKGSSTITCGLVLSRWVVKMIVLSN